MNGLQLFLLAMMLATGTSCVASPPRLRDDNAPDPRVQAFYYGWYGNPAHDREYIHWQQGGHRPPETIAADYYPKLGAYSSTDPDVLRQHMAWVREAGVGVIVVSWWGAGSREDKGVAAVLDAADRAGVGVNFHIEPYERLTPDRAADDIASLVRRFGDHPAVRRSEVEGRLIFYVFQALKHPAAAWKPALERLRRDHDNIAILAQTTDLGFITAAGFDGGYTYDVLAPFKDENFLSRWPALAQAFKESGKWFVPSVGPGYVDDRAVPNGATETAAARTRDNGAGSTYDRMWKAAVDMDAPVITITSFNEWHEGTQIEPATAREGHLDYAAGEDQYLKQTRAWAERWRRDRR